MKFKNINSLRYSLVNHPLSPGPFKFPYKLQREVVNIIYSKQTEIFLNVFPDFSEFSDKNRGSNLSPSHLLCKRPRCYHSISKTQVADRIFKLGPIHASVIYQIP